MAAGSKAGLYQNAQSTSYLPLTLVATLTHRVYRKMIDIYEKNLIKV